MLFLLPPMATTPLVDFHVLDVKSTEVSPKFSPFVPFDRLASEYAPSATAPVDWAYALRPSAVVSSNNVCAFPPIATELPLKVFASAPNAREVSPLASAETPSATAPFEPDFTLDARPMEIALSELVSTPVLVPIAIEP